jgi:hypothetical protein
MGLPSAIKKLIMARYGKAFLEATAPRAPIRVIDFMQHVKSIPDEMTSAKDFARWLVKTKVLDLLERSQYNGVTMVIVCVDRDRLPNKVKRSRGKLEVHEKAPHIVDDIIPEDWAAFSSSRKRLQRELFPLIFNAFMDENFARVEPGQEIILNGFPGIYDVEFRRRTAMVGHGGWEVDMRPKQVLLWHHDELPLTKHREEKDKDLYNRVFTIKGLGGTPQCPYPSIQRTEWVKAKNGIQEADMSVFFFNRWFSKFDHIIDINDGDAIPIGLAYTLERVEGQSYRNNHYLMLKNATPRTKKKQKLNTGIGTRQSHTYVDLNLLHKLVLDDPEFLRAGVQNHVVFLCFAIVMGGTDYMSGHMHGIGKDKIMWPALMKHVSAFSHIVQLSKNIQPDFIVPRTIVFDESAFRQFAYRVYAEKYSNRYGGGDKMIKLSELRRVCSVTAKGTPIKNSSLHLPQRNVIQSWGRRALWNLLYIVNGPRSRESVPDPFESVGEHSYYGFTKNGPVDKVAAQTKPIDEVYRQHFYEVRRKRARKKRIEISPSRKIRTAEEMGDEVRRITQEDDY